MADAQAILLSKFAGLESSLTTVAAEQCEIRQLIHQLRCDVVDGFALHGAITPRSTRTQQRSARERIEAGSPAARKVGIPLAAANAKKACCDNAFNVTKSQGQLDMDIPKELMDKFRSIPLYSIVVPDNVPHTKLQELGSPFTKLDGEEWLTISGHDWVIIDVKEKRNGSSLQLKADLELKPGYCITFISAGNGIVHGTLPVDESQSRIIADLTVGSQLRAKLVIHRTDYIQRASSGKITFSPTDRYTVLEGSKLISKETSPDGDVTYTFEYRKLDRLRLNFGVPHLAEGPYTLDVFKFNFATDPSPHRCISSIYSIQTGVPGLDLRAKYGISCVGVIRADGKSSHVAWGPAPTEQVTVGDLCVALPLKDVESKFKDMSETFGGRTQVTVALQPKFNGFSQAASPEGREDGVQLTGADVLQEMPDLELRDGLEEVQRQVTIKLDDRSEIHPQPPSPESGTPRSEGSAAHIFNYSHPDWPLSLQLRSCFDDVGKKSVASTTSSTLSRAYLAQANSRKASSASSTHSSTLSQEFIVLPTSRTRVTLDLIGTVLLAWDLVLIPLQLAWDFTLTGGFIALSLSITIFWTLDIFFNFRTAYYRTNSVIEVRPFQIATHYLRSMFLLDLIVVASDWLYIAADLMPSTVRMARIAKATKIIRLIRIFRVLRFNHLDHFISLITGIGLPLLESVKVSCFIIYCAHLFSCMWFMVGQRDATDTGIRWLDQTWANGSPAILEAPTAFQYASAMQWTLSTILSGSTAVLPRNSVEQIICCMIILFGLLFQAFVVSMLSSSAVEHKARQRDLRVIVSTLRRFCIAQHVSKQVTVAALSQTRDAITRHANARDGIKGVEGLQLISSKMLSSVLREVFEPHVSRHDFFLLWSQADEPTFSKLLKTAMDLIIVRDTQDVFVANEAATHTYLSCFGKATYMQNPHSSKELETQTVEVLQDRWMAEAALWTHWIHVGTLEVVSYECVVHCIKADMFPPIVQSCAILKEVVGTYAVEYHRCLTKAMPPFAPWPSDLDVHNADFAEILPILPEFAQDALNTLALGVAVNIGLVGAGNAEVIQKELSEGKSNIILTKSASRPILRRTVSVVRVSVLRDDQVFAQLGIWKNGNLIPECMLPGRKRRDSDDVNALIKQTLKTLEEHIGELEFVSIDFGSTNTKSQRIGIPTQYLITTAHYRIKFGVGPKTSRSSTSSGASAMIASIPLGNIGESPNWNTRKRNHLMTVSHPCKASLEQRLRISNNLILLQNRTDETCLCMWLTAAEIEFLQSPEGTDMLMSLSNKGDLMPQLVREIIPEGGAISDLPIARESSGDTSSKFEIIV